MAYPIAVTVAPVLIALGTTIWPWGILSITAWDGIVNISCGVAILVVSWVKVQLQRLFSAFKTTLMVAAYSTVDEI